MVLHSAEEAQAWLNGFTVAAGASFRDWASKSDQNLAAARSELRRAITAREARLAAAEVLAGLHKQLADAVFASTRDRQWADLFLRSWKGKCDSPAALKDILALLKKSRRCSSRCRERKTPCSTTPASLWPGRETCLPQSSRQPPSARSRECLDRHKSYSVVRPSKCS